MKYYKVLIVLGCLTSIYLIVRFGDYQVEGVYSSKDSRIIIRAIQRPTTIAFFLPPYMPPNERAKKVFQYRQGGIFGFYKDVISYNYNESMESYTDFVRFYGDGHVVISYGQPTVVTYDDGKTWLTGSW